MRILVLDGDENQAVACVRSLGRAGHHVAVGSPNSWCKAGLSRFAEHRFRYPSPQQSTTAFVSGMLDELREHGDALVLPMTERTTLPLSENRDAVFQAGGNLVLPSHCTVLKAFDKSETTALARRLGVSVPESIIIENEADARAASVSFPKPAVLKPRSSQEASKNGSLHQTGRPVYARTEQEFLDAYLRIRQRCSSVIAQEFIDGVGAGYFAVVAHGSIKAEFAHRRIRDVHPTGSGSSLRESVVVTPEIRKASAAILTALGWHGVAMIEFRLRNDGRPVFIEVNGRFWNSLALAVYAGCDFPLMLAELAQSGTVEQAVPYRVGVRCRWPLGDLRHLVAVWQGALPGFPGSFPGRVNTLLEFMTPHPGTYHDNFMWDDPLPEVGDWADFFLRRVPNQLLGRN